MHLDQAGRLVVENSDDSQEIYCYYDAWLYPDPKDRPVRRKYPVAHFPHVLGRPTTQTLLAAMETVAVDIYDNLGLGRAVIRAAYERRLELNAQLGEQAEPNIENRLGAAMAAQTPAST